MPTAPAVSPVVRAILLANVDLTADDVIRKARAKGVSAPESSIRGLVYNIRSEIRKGVTRSSPATTRPVQTSQTSPKSASKPSTSAKLSKPAPKAASSAKLATATARPAPGGGSTGSSALTGGVTQVLANVARVNQVVGACGGVEHARETAEAVRACGGVEAFLKHLDLVAEIQDQTSA